MSTKEGITTDRFNEAVREVAREAGVDALLAIPGVWEEASEHYNNAAIDRLTAEERTPCTTG